MDPEGSMRPTYRHADLLGLSELVLTECAYVNNTGGKNEKCCYPVSGGRGGGFSRYMQ